MQQTPIPYEKLTSKVYQSGVFARKAYQLYLGPDHLLNVISENYEETYHRFYFSDIQLIQVLQTKTRELAARVGGGVVAALLTMFTIGYFFFDWSLMAVSILGGVTLIVGSWLFVYALKGSTCRCKLFTATGEEPLISVNRIPLARRVLEKIVPAIHGAQKDLNPAGAAEPDLSIAAESIQPTATAPSVEHPFSEQEALSLVSPAPPTAPPPIRPGSMVPPALPSILDPKAPALAFWLGGSLLICLLLTAADFFLLSPALSALAVIAWSVAMIVAICVVVRKGQLPGMKTTASFTIGLSVGLMIAGYGYMVAMAVQREGAPQPVTPGEWFRPIAETATGDSLFVTVFYTIATVGALLLFVFTVLHYFSPGKKNMN